MEYFEKLPFLIGHCIDFRLIDHLIELYTLFLAKNYNLANEDGVDKILCIFTVDKIVYFDRYRVKESLLPHFLKVRSKLNAFLCFLASHQCLANRNIFFVSFILKDD